MRLITGDELGLLKEIIPELCRPPLTDASGLPINTPTWMGNAAQYNRRSPRPSATTIQAAANSYNGSNNSGAVQRLGGDEAVMTRDRGLISLSFVNKKDGDAFQFAALRIDGSVETWSAARDVPYTHEKNSEANVTPARYRMVSHCENVFRFDQSQPEEEEEGTGKGWYVNPPVKPIGMVCTTSNDKSILAAADSSGNISIINDKCKVVSRYHAYNEATKEGAVLTYTKGGFVNNHITTCIGVDGTMLAVGGRERGVRVLDLETGKGIWKVSFIT